MNIIKTILLVAFIIIAVLLVLMVLVQNEDSNGMGSAFGGGQTAAFGSHSASVLSKTTGVFVALFFVTIFVLALLNKNPSDDSLEMSRTAAESGSTAVESSSSTNWFEDSSASDGASASGATTSDITTSESTAQ
ncbi:MAG: preprotein translocase subunit SecG [Treponema sp.]|nr:preprotein translocase subunit SecG [Treponema sp.]MBQ5383691.1 preprotein translocase subunit SecG [Treponema sp.]